MLRIRETLGNGFRRMRRNNIRVRLACRNSDYGEKVCVDGRALPGAITRQNCPIAAQFDLEVDRKFRRRCIVAESDCLPAKDDPGRIRSDDVDVISRTMVSPQIVPEACNHLELGQGSHRAG